MGPWMTRGVELGGVKMAVAVPSGLAWHSRDEDGHEACSPSDAEVWLRVCPLAAQPEVESPVAYPYADGVLEVGRIDRDWVLAVRDHARYSRLARFDPSFTHGDLMVSPEVTSAGACPLSHPLDRGIAAHRAVLAGSLVVWGSAAVREGRALVFLGDSRPAALGADLARGWIVLRRDASAGVRVSSLTFVPGRATVRDVALHAIHVSEPMCGSALAPDLLDHECAAGELLRYAFAPAGGMDIAEPMLETANALAERVHVLRLGLTSARRFAWSPGPTGVRAAVS